MMNWKVVLGILTCNVVMMSASYTMIIPFLPLYLSNELKADPDTVSLWTGAIFAVCFAVTAIMAPIWGKMSDSHGKKLMVMRSSSLIAVVYILGALVQTPLQLFLVRVLQGFAAGLWPASLSLMSAYVPKAKIGISMGIMQSANICGGIIGPLFGGILAQAFGMRVSFFIAGGALVIITLTTLFFIKEPPREHKEPQAGTGESSKDTSAPSPYRALLGNPTIRMLLLCTGLTNMVILLLQPIMTIYIGQLRGTEENLIMVSGIVFSFSGIAGALAAPIWGRQGQAHGFFKTEVISLFAAGVLICSQFIPSTLVPFAILNFIVGLGFSGIFPSANSMIIVHTELSQRGTAFGLLFSAQQIGGTIGPLAGGLLASFIDLSYIFPIAGSILICMSILLFFKAPAAMRQKPGAQSIAAQSRKEVIDRIKQEVYVSMRQQEQKQERQDSASALVSAETERRVYSLPPEHQIERSAEGASASLLAQVESKIRKNTALNETADRQDKLKN